MMNFVTQAFLAPHVHASVGFFTFWALWVSVTDATQMRYTTQIFASFYYDDI